MPEPVDVDEVGCQPEAETENRSPDLDCRAAEGGIVDNVDAGELEPPVADPSRRAVLLGATGAVGAAATLMGLGSRAASAAHPDEPGEYIWALNGDGFTVPSDTWTKIPWPWVVLNTTTATVEADQAGWIFPAAAGGIYALVCNIAWDNALSPSNTRIAPPTHRKLARIIQQGLTGSVWNQAAYTASSTDLTYHADLALLGDQDVLSDGSKGYQQQQVYIQFGYEPSQGDQRFWIEVYQNSGVPLACRFDGTSAPATAGRPLMIGLQAPSLMIIKLSSW
jgi:hypothetical protein